jgi:hemerythrin-like domain-containing protein
MVALCNGARRAFIRNAGKIGLMAGGGSMAISAASSLIGPVRAEELPRNCMPGDAVTPSEYLMREHGMLNRILLIYEAGLRKFDANEDFDPSPIANAARIVREYTEDYHERLEEEVVFPRFKQAGKMVALVDILIDQHRSGRGLTDIVLETALTGRKNDNDRRRLVDALRSFIAIYRPHTAREDTVLLPMLKGLFAPGEYEGMAEKIEKSGRRYFVAGSFDGMVQRVASFETAMGINDLSQFTRL